HIRSTADTAGGKPRIRGPASPCRTSRSDTKGSGRAWMTRTHPERHRARLRARGNSRLSSRSSTLLAERDRFLPEADLLHRSNPYGRPLVARTDTVARTVLD